jgi:DNA polymerase-3 subunit gamma/tau
MSPIALYRKYRPKNFKELLGQDHIVRVLEGSIKLGNIAHAYLFSGSRGTGKTSLARIFARVIGVTDNDLYEIDAASNRGIDDIRAIREAVNTLPLESPFKVYIVDEAHMLTKEAFNALLKTLEEPPKHVIFILATTEPDRLPETVASRCQQFSFKKPSQKILGELIAAVAKKEGFELERSSADLISILSEGSFRDAHGILQKVIGASADQKISTAEVLAATGAPRGELVNDFIRAVSEKQLNKGLEAVEAAVGANVEIKVYLNLILHKIRAVLLLRYAPEMERDFTEEFSESDFDFLKKLAADKLGGINSRVLAKLLEAYDGVGRPYLPALSLELALIGLFPADGN